MINHLPGNINPNIFELTSNGLIISDAQGICHSINSAALLLLGKTKDEIVGFDLNQLFYTCLDTGKAQEISHFLSNPQKTELELKGVTFGVKDGEELYLDISLNKGLEDFPLGSTLITIDDITSYYQELIKLKKNQELLDHILNNSNDVIYVQDLKCRNLIVNKRYEDAFGVLKDDVIGKVGAAQPDHVMEEVMTNDQRVINSDQPITFEEKILHGSNYHTYLSKKFPLRDAQGDVYAIGGISTDITKRRQRDRLNSCLNNIIATMHTPIEFTEIMQKVLTDSSFSMEADKAIISMREQDNWVLRYGYGKLQYSIGYSFINDEIPISNYVSETKNIVYIDNNHQEVKFIKSLIHKLGIKACIVIPLISQDNVIGVLMYLYNHPKNFNDIEIDFVRKLSSSVSLALDNANYRDNLETLVQVRTSQLRSSEERFSKAFHSNPNLMAISSLKDGRYIEANNSFLNVLGYNLEEVIGRTTLELGILTSDVRSRIIEQVKKQGEVLNFECKFKTKSGQMRDGLLSASLIEINGETCILHATKDVTERNSLIREITRLDQLNLVGEMAAGIGHEIRNPMTTVRGFLQMLSNKQDCAHYNEYFDIMIDELDRANSIITEFLSMAKNKVVSLSSNNLNDIVTAISSLINSDAIIQDKRIILDLKETPDILIDEKETRQLIINLSRNGLEAMGPGGTLTISTYYDAGKVVLAVQDEGKGIKPDILEKLGTPFFTTKDNGTGLGLAVCYSIAARHKAQIQIESCSKGSTFYVYYPA